MRKIFWNRLLQAALVAWGVGTLTFVMMRSLPGDMAYRIAAGRYGYDNVTAAAAESVRTELGLDQPAVVQYFNWLGDLLTFRLGHTMVSGAPVIGEVQHQLGHSALLAFVALFFSILIALPLGIFTAFRQGGWLDRGTLFVSSLLRSLPVFVVGLVLILLFALELRWFPVAGFGSVRHLVLPALALALTLAAVSSRVVHESTYQVLQSGYYQFARLKGLDNTAVFMRHGLRNMLVPVVAFMGVQLITLIEGIVMLESLFSWPGIGHGLAHAIFARDIPMIQGAALVMGLAFVVLNALIDLVCYSLDPRSQLT
ncbi:MAG: ABC transporter permease [Thiothrix sp.]|nr:ABC transporter permease [Thiothrix sp.]HPQ94037.1 ABC transporter permease [Thiolinea sp.]